MISRNQQVGLMMLALTSLSVVALGFASSPQEAVAAQSCSQKGGDITVNACVNADVTKNNICVGVLTETQRCQT